MSVIRIISPLINAVFPQVFYLRIINPVMIFFLAVDNAPVADSTGILSIENFFPKFQISFTV